MPFQVSPGVNVSEIDLTTIVPAVSTTEGAIAGVFRWGPIGKAILVDSEDKLAARFGKPDSTNPETFFTAANFLAYGNKLYVSRAANTTDTTGITGVLTAVANTGAYANTILIKNDDDYDLLSNPDTDVLYAAKYPGALGNSLKVSVCDSVNAYGSNLNMFIPTSGSIIVANSTGGNATFNLLDNTKISNAGIVFTVGSNQATIFIANSGSWDTGATSGSAQYGLEQMMSYSFIVGNILKAGNTQLGTQDLRITALAANAVHAAGNTTFVINLDSNYTLSSNYYANTVVINWEYYNAVDKAPGTSVYTKKFGNSSAVDELHVVVADEDGKFTGVPGTILETFRGLSRATDAKTEDGATLYYKEVLNQNSNYTWWINHRSGAIGNTAVNIVNSTNPNPVTLSFVTGSDGATEANAAIGDLTRGYDLFKSAEDIDVSLILQGKSRGASNTAQLANYLIDNIAESRKDCVVFISPDKDDVVNNVGKTEVTDVVGFRNALTSTSYAVMDSGYKYQYDKYNDVYRYIPLNGDIAGLAVRTDNVRDPWYSPAGFNRGQIKNIIKLAYNPAKADRDILYKSDVNPVCIFPGQGTVLFGDKTVLGKPSAFDRINVRRLFIVLEKAIATAAKFTLFEFNDDFTRAQFRNLVEPFLRDVQGRRGIYDFKVVCDETNNTGDVIDRNEFIGDIYVKPARSINFIQLNFVAVRTGVEFSEVVGNF
jgi:phage tail sheath protein FI